ncbi:DUF2127 domain-containing protein [Nocardioides sp. LS1]|uniref:DUF2127 domain-containing protein n=1 Tax=Nocardioides sp. LS1 TaxID=1027620 RepID=UPI000FFAC1AD|nr:DUF2127 domain-containing protein [Nocardioides sp. LS1]GCD92079.1 hypothetical protein NLS1_40850 [Nocardioides sp. LS1]
MNLRPLRHFSWSLRSCGIRGHVTYKPDEQDLAERLHTETAVGEAWRCLRCEDFVPGPPHGSGPAEDAPIVLKDKALKDAVILRLLAAERLVRGILLVALAYGIYRFDGAKDSLQQVFAEYLPRLQPLAERAGIDLQNAGPVKLIEEALKAQHSTLKLVILGVAAYGALQLLEAVGLWSMQRWGEYVAMVGTSALIPLEVYELLHTVTPFKIAALVLNLFAVFYLLWTKRLFGFRGGKEAFEAERHGMSLLEVERAAVDAPRSR